jgi:hypothetical protein
VSARLDVVAGGGVKVAGRLGIVVGTVGEDRVALGARGEAVGCGGAAPVWEVPVHEPSRPARISRRAVR